MKYKKYNNAKMKEKKKVFCFDDARRHMSSYGAIFGIDYEFMSGKIIPLSSFGVARVESY